MWTFQSHRWCLWRHNGGGVYEERAWKAPFHGLQTEDPCASTLPQRLFRLWGNGGTGKYRNNKIQKIKNYKKQKYKSNRDKKTHYLRQDLVKRLCLANVALSFKLQPESEMGLSRSSNPQASDEAWFPHKSCHDIHYSASHRASLPRPPVHFRWTTLRLRATQCKCYTSKEREPEESLFALIHPKALYRLLHKWPLLLANA